MKAIKLYLTFIHFIRISFIFSFFFFLNSCVVITQNRESESNSNLKSDSLIVKNNLKGDSNSVASIKIQLKKLENALSIKKELDQYSKALPYFKNDEEKLEFLSLTGYEYRQKWLIEKNFLTRNQEKQKQLQDIIQAQDIVIGMPQNLVKKSWGEPDSIEVSGNPIFKNELWRYVRFISTLEGYKSEKRLVYFEGGKVVGWEME